MTLAKSQQIAYLLKEAQFAHHDFEESEMGGQEDHEWPPWYAEYLLENDFAGMVTASVDKDRLAALLKEIDDEYNAKEREISWENYAANRLSAELG